MYLIFKIYILGIVSLEAIKAAIVAKYGSTPNKDLPLPNLEHDSDDETDQDISLIKKRKITKNKKYLTIIVNIQHI